MTRGAPITAAQKRGLVVFVLAACTLACLVTGLNGDLSNSDDSMFAWSVRDSVRRGAWLEYEWFGVSFQLAYPPLGYALTSISARLFGFTEVAFRLVPALCSCGAALVAFAIVRRLGCALWAAAFATLSLVSLSVYYYFARTAGVDGLLVLTLMLTQLAIVAALDRPGLWTWVGVAAGAAIMTKGPAAALPLLGMLAMLLVARHRPSARHLGRAVLVTTLVALPWHVGQLIRHGGWLLHNYVGFNVVDRATAQIAGDQTPFHFYVSALVELDPIVGGVVLLGAGFAIATWWRDRDARLAPLIGATVLSLLVFSSSQTRILKYLMPSLAFMCVLAAVAAHRLLDRYRLAPAILALPVAVFFAHTAPQTSGEPLAPGQRQLSERARDLLAPGETLYVLDDYHVATAYYVDRPTLLLTPDPRAYATLIAVPGLRLSGTVKLVPAAEIAAFLRAAGARALLVERRLLPLMGPTDPAALGFTRRQALGEYTLFWAADP
ncbi:MAG TPA: glycosyltransferase family 39 protein [Kofleriaceae bacterium]|nr:glycosyltransferase family 39 protein [Kofleriaceae bacterium]